MSKHIRLILIIVLSTVLIVAATVVITRQIEYKRGNDVYAAAEQLAAGTPQTEGSSSEGDVSAVLEGSAADPYALQLATVDLAALQQSNEEVIGWIFIPDTVVNYPIVQAADNDYYLDHTWNLEKNSVGAIFLECENAADFSEFNTIIYGHNMRNGSMFGGLKEYREVAYFQQHPSVYLMDVAGVRRYDIFAAYETGVRTITYGLRIEDEENKNKVIAHALENSVIDTGIRPTVEDRIITLSTCTGNGHSTRWVIQAVLTE